MVIVRQNVSIGSARFWIRSLRGSRDFADQEQWRQYMEAVLDKANRAWQDRLQEELRAMKTLTVTLAGNEYL